jgi:ABC-type sugar transport system substrate-binding protein
MRKLTRLVTLVLTLVLCLTAVASAEGFKIGMATREITNDFNRDIISGAQAVIEAAGAR